MATKKLPRKERIRFVARKEDFRIVLRPVAAQQNPQASGREAGEPRRRT